MSDDHDDQDEPGGLWDPDAFNPPPAPTRPALHIVATPGTPHALDSPADATPDFQATDDHTLVRLEQFKPSDTTQRPSSHRTPAVTRRVVATAIAAIAVAATALGSTLLSPVERASQPAPTQNLGAHVGADAEQAASTRTVVSASSAARDERRAKSRAERHAKSPRSPVARSPNHSPISSAQRAPTTTASHTTTTASTIVRRAARPPRPQASAATASSEFGFEG